MTLVHNFSFAAWAGLRVAVSLSAAQAEDLTPPVVNQPIANVTVNAGAAPTVISLKNTFGLQGVTQEVVRFTTTLGDIDVELFPATTPRTVADFLGYVNRGAASNGGYNDSLIQRAVVTPTPFILQGGSFYVSGYSIAEIPQRAAIKSEAGIPNTTGTIAMALSSGPDSATDAWYFNLADNSYLDGTKSGGPYTVFGRVIENGMTTVNAIAALTIYNLSDDFGVSGNLFETVPLVYYNLNEGLSASDFVYVNEIASIPLTGPAGSKALMRLEVLHNTDPDLVTATINGQKLRLTYLKKLTGDAKITLQATDSAGHSVKTSFTVKVRK